MSEIRPDIERVARALCLADGKDPEGVHEFKTCAGPSSMKNWQYHYPFAAQQAIKAMWQDPNEKPAGMPDDIWETAYDEADAFSDVYGCDEVIRARLTRAFAQAVEAERERCAVVAYAEAVIHCSARDGQTFIGHTVGHCVAAAIRRSDA